ncbi:hypothetical protein MASR1M32_19880 [Rhodobacter sp.]
MACLLATQCARLRVNRRLIRFALAAMRLQLACGLFGPRGVQRALRFGAAELCGIGIAGKAGGLAGRLLFA